MDKMTTSAVSDFRRRDGTLLPVEEARVSVTLNGSDPVHDDLVERDGSGRCPRQQGSVISF